MINGGKPENIIINLQRFISSFNSKFGTRNSKL